MAADQRAGTGHPAGSLHRGRRRGREGEAGRPGGRPGGAHGRVDHPGGPARPYCGDAAPGPGSRDSRPGGRPGDAPGRVDHNGGGQPHTATRAHRHRTARRRHGRSPTGGARHRPEPVGGARPQDVARRTPAGRSRPPSGRPSSRDAAAARSARRPASTARAWAGTAAPVPVVRPRSASTPAVGSPAHRLVTGFTGLWVVVRIVVHAVESPPGSAARSGPVRGARRRPGGGRAHVGGRPAPRPELPPPRGAAHRPRPRPPASGVRRPAGRFHGPGSGRRGAPVPGGGTGGHELPL